MPYDAKPDLNDVILSAWEERDRLHVALYLRKGEDDQGELICECWDGDCARMFEDGFFKRSKTPGRLSDNDETLARSVLDYAIERKLGALTRFEKGILDGLALAEEKAVVLHEKLAAEHADDEDFDAIQTAAADAITAHMPAMSDDRLHDVHEYLQEFLETRLAPTPAP